jgi:hypothetical protein
MKIPAIVAELLAQTPSVQAAMKAGRKTSIHTRIIRANGRIEEGPSSTIERSWAEWFRWMQGKRIIFRFVTREGKEIERVNY